MRRLILALFILAGLGAAAVAITPQPAAAVCQQMICPFRPIPTPSPSPAVEAPSRLDSLRPDFHTFIMGPTGMWVGYQEEYLVTVRNIGMMGAQGVAFTVTLPAAVAAESIEYTNQGFICTIPTPQRVTCVAGLLGPHGEEGYVRINVRGVAPTSGGEQIVATADPNGIIAEVSDENNTDRYPVRVIVRP